MQLLFRIKFIIVVLVMLTGLSGCAKDYDLNPWTTVMKQVIKASYEVEQKVCISDVNSCVDQW